MWKVKVAKGGAQTDRVPPNVAHVNKDASTDAATNSREAKREWEEQEHERDRERGEVIVRRCRNSSASPVVIVSKVSASTDLNSKRVSKGLRAVVILHRRLFSDQRGLDGLCQRKNVLFLLSSQTFYFGVLFTHNSGVDSLSPIPSTRLCLFYVG